MRDLYDLPSAIKCTGLPDLPPSETDPATLGKASLEHRGTSFGPCVGRGLDPAGEQVPTCADTKVFLMDEGVALLRTETIIQMEFPTNTGDMHFEVVFSHDVSHYDSLVSLSPRLVDKPCLTQNSLTSRDIKDFFTAKVTNLL